MDGRSRRPRPSRLGSDAGRERAEVLRAVADGIDARAEELSRVETRDNGSLLRSHRRGVMPRVGDELPLLRRLGCTSSITRTRRSAGTASESPTTRPA